MVPTWDQIWDESKQSASDLLFYLTRRGFILSLGDHAHGASDTRQCVHWCSQKMIKNGCLHHSNCVLAQDLRHNFNFVWYAWLVWCLNFSKLINVFRIFSSVYFLSLTSMVAFELNSPKSDYICTKFPSIRVDFIK